MRGGEPDVCEPTHPWRLSGGQRQRGLNLAGACVLN
jgi:hypothetical protein